MSKTIKEMLNEPLDMKLVENPNVTPGLAEKLDAATQKHHMTIEELRQSSAKHNQALCRERMKALAELLGKPHWRDDYNGATQTVKDLYAVNFIRAFPETDDALDRDYLQGHIYPLLRGDDLDHLIANLHNEVWRQRLNEMREDYLAWKAR